MSEPHDRTADLDRLADAVIENLGIEHEELCIGEDVRYRLPRWVLELIGAEEEGFEEYRDHYDRWFTDEQNRYALALWDDVLGHIKDRWRATRGGKNQEQ